MSLVTVYIGVLILALVIGNGLLSLTKGHGPPRRQVVRQARMVQAQRQSPPPFTPSPAPSPENGNLTFESRLKALDEMTRMAHGRIEDLENQMKSTPKNNHLAEGEPAEPLGELNGLANDVTSFKEESTRNIQELKSQSAQLFQDMSEKIRALDHFKANTKVELQGVREVAANMQAALKEAAQVKTDDGKQELLLELDEIQSRLDRLHAFKTNTEVELKALKELVLILKEIVAQPKESGEAWVKGNGRSRNFDQDLAKFRKVSVNMKRMA